MAGPRVLAKGFSFWPEDAIGVAQTSDLQKLYEAGFAGCFSEPHEEAALYDEIRAAGGSIDGEAIAHSSGFADSGAGKLVLPYVPVLQAYPGGLPGPNQIGGSCVAQSKKNADLVTVVCEVMFGHPDEATGLLEGLPVVSETGIRNGVFAPEWNYIWRGYQGDGWSCQASVRVGQNQSGCCLPRASYPEINVDLTTYTRANQYSYGARTPPDSYKTLGLKHVIRTATVIRSPEACRDFLHQGYGVTTCGSEGFSSRRNEDGVSSRSGSWAHAMAIIGFDDRPETIAKYGGPLVLVLNSWGPGWNSGPRIIRGTNIEIPAGSFWARWADVRNRYMCAVSSVLGWPPRTLPDYGATGII